MKDKLRLNRSLAIGASAILLCGMALEHFGLTNEPQVFGDQVAEAPRPVRKLGSPKPTNSDEPAAAANRPSTIRHRNPIPSRFSTNSNREARIVLRQPYTAGIVSMPQAFRPPLASRSSTPAQASTQPRLLPWLMILAGLLAVWWFARMDWPRKTCKNLFHTYVKTRK